MTSQLRSCLTPANETNVHGLRHSHTGVYAVQGAGAGCRLSMASPLVRTIRPNPSSTSCGGHLSSFRPLELSPGQALRSPQSRLALRKAADLPTSFSRSSRVELLTLEVGPRHQGCPRHCRRSKKLRPKESWLAHSGGGRDRGAVRSSTSTGPAQVRDISPESRPTPPPGRKVRRDLSLLLAVARRSGKRSSDATTSSSACA